MPTNDLTQFLNIGMIPFMLFMAWSFWNALQRAGDKYDALVERVIVAVENNTRAFLEGRQESRAICDNLSAHDDRVDDVRDKIDLIDVTTQSTEKRTMRIEEMLKRHAETMERQHADRS